MTRCVEHGWTRNKKVASILTAFTKILPGPLVVKKEEFKERKQCWNAGFDTWK